MTTDPFMTDTPDLLTRSLSHVVAARIVLPTPETITLDVQGGRLSFNEAQWPRVQATLDVRVPTDAALLARIDPRTGARVEIDVGYVRPGGVVDVHTVADLVLRSRPVSRPSDVMRVTAASDESLFIDSAPVTGVAFTAASTTAAIQTVLRTVFPTLTPVVTSPVGPAITQGPYDDRVDLVLDLADRIGARVFDDGLRTWHVDPAPVLGTPDLDLAVGSNGTILGSEAELTREEDWGNVVLLRYRWRDTSDVEHTIVSVRRVTTGVYAANVGNQKILEFERSVSTTQTEANAAAAALVARTVTRGRALSVQAISAYWLRPGATANVTLPSGPTEQHLVTSVDFDLGNGTMQVDTRLPDNTGTIGA